MNNPFHTTLTTGVLTALLLAANLAQADAEPYAGMLDALRAEITAKLPDVDGAARKRIVDAKDAAARIEAVKNLPQLDAFLASDALDAKLAKFFILQDGTPEGLAAYARQGDMQKKLIDFLLGNEQLMLQMAVADGARPVEMRKGGSDEANYGRAMEIYVAIRKASPKSSQGIFQRLALAVSLAYSGRESKNDVGTNVSGESAPVRRYLHYEKAYEAGELDPNFDRLSVWDLRFVVSAQEPDELLAWGREMLRNFRPEHIFTENEGWRYANLVSTDVKYGSVRVKYDRPELFGMQNILMNGGICGRQAAFARFICRAFGIPATPRPSSGHGATARWTPTGWSVVLGPPWRHGWTTTRYRDGLDFVAHTQARSRGKAFLKVKRAFWIGDVMGENRVYGDGSRRGELGFWNAVALGTQARINDEVEAVVEDALGADLGEGRGPTVAEKIAASALNPEDREISLASDGTITIPAAAGTQAKGGDTDEDGGTSKDVIVMKSFQGGLQAFLPRFSRQPPILVRGGSWRHEANLCTSAERHWKGRRPRTSYFMRGLRLAVTPDDDEQPPPELELEVADGVTMEFVYIPPGTFIMGGDRETKSGDYLANTPKHEVELTQGFYLGKYEVTQAQFEAVTGTVRGKSGKGPDYPVDSVSSGRALLFCDAVSVNTGKDVRLPTEAEWEYAARAGSDSRWFFGDDPARLEEYAWFKDNAEGKSHPVGQKKPNPWGLYDMYGNIAEYVSDEHQEDYYANSPREDPTGPLLGIFSSMKYSINVPKAGAYTLIARGVTMHENQTLKLSVNDDEPALRITMPWTLGKWGESEPITLVLQEGQNTLHVWRDEPPQYGIAVKSFTLAPTTGQ